MDITYSQAQVEDIACIYRLCTQLIQNYENMEIIDYDKVQKWIQKKITNRITEYTAIYADGQKAGYYHFFKNEESEFEIDDLYIFPEYQNKGLGTKVIRKCCSAVDAPVMLYVFIKNQRAVSLYKKLGFEVVRTIQDSRYIMKNKNNSRKYYAAYSLPSDRKFLRKSDGPGKSGEAGHGHHRLHRP